MLFNRSFVIASLAIFLQFAGSAFAADPAVEAIQTWSGKIRDETLKKHAPESGFISDAKAWDRLYRAWRPDEDVPDLNFEETLVLVGTVPGPNLVLMTPTMNAEADVQFVVGGTRIGGPGFGYKLISVARQGVKSINGNPLEEAESVTVRVIGILRTGIIAIGGETTGTTITAKNITWELDLKDDATFREKAERLDGKLAKVEGRLERKEGVEVPERWIVTVTALDHAEN
ncbi:MAG: hypothetical protein KF861_23755 [Planctomycetaceae bacterium]|nr:hypothetical protein [Planctomycetaceae bacterium]